MIVSIYFQKTRKEEEIVFVIEFFKINNQFIKIGCKKDIVELIVE